MTSPRPPGDPPGLTPEQLAARQLLPLLARVAAGERRDDLVLSWSTTSAHITTVTTIHGDGQVRQGQSVQRLDARPLIGHAVEGEVAQLCAALVASGFPALRPPPGPPAPPTVPPVQLGASAGGHALYAAVPAQLANWVFSDRVDTRIVPPRFGDASGVRGAAWLGSEDAV